MRLSNSTRNDAPVFRLTFACLDRQPLPGASVRPQITCDSDRPGCHSLRIHLETLTRRQGINRGRQTPPVSWHHLVNRPPLVAPPALPLAALEAVLRTALAAAVAHQGESLMRAPLTGSVEKPNQSFAVVPKHIRKFLLACRSSSRSRSPTPAISPKQIAPAESILPPPPGRDAKQDAKQDTKPEPKSDSRTEPKPELKQEAKQDAKAVSQEPAVKAEPAARGTSPPAKVPHAALLAEPAPTLQIMQCSLCENAATCSLCLE